MLTETTLLELKSKMPAKYTPLIKKAYKERFNESVSRWTIMRFFDGLTYSEDLHVAVLDVVSMQHTLMERTEGLING